MDKAIAEPCKSNADIWIFGYGSLIWSQNFAFNRYEIAVLPNYARYFWQGSWEARGSQDLPGRVATIIEEEKSEVWGAAIRVCPKSRSETESYLAKRETGYDLVKCEVTSAKGEIIEAWVFIARKENAQYMGPAKTSLIAAEEILQSCGKNGRCLDYLVNLVSSLQLLVPKPHIGCDNHLLQLESAVRWRLYNLTLHYETLLSAPHSRQGQIKSRNEDTALALATQPWPVLDCHKEAHGDLESLSSAVEAQPLMLHGLA